MSELSRDFFYTDGEGYEGHIQIKEATITELAATSDYVATYLKDIGAKPRYQKAAPVATATTSGAAADPMVAAATAVFPGATVQARCPNDGSVMRTKAAGVSARTGKPYRAFNVCDMCQFKANA